MGGQYRKPLKTLDFFIYIVWLGKRLEMADRGGAGHFFGIFNNSTSKTGAILPIIHHHNLEGSSENPGRDRFP